MTYIGVGPVMVNRYGPGNHKISVVRVFKLHVHEISPENLKIQ